MNSAITQTEREPICGTHLIRLTHLLRGYVGYCSRCQLFVASANHSPVTLSPEIAAKREAAQQPKPKSQQMNAAPIHDQRSQASARKHARAVRRR